MTRYWILSAFLIGGAVSWYIKPKADPITQTRIVKGDTVTVTKIVEKVVKADGTKIERTTETGQRSKVETKSTTTAKPQYRVGVQVRPLDYKDFTVTTSRRALGDLWLETSYRPKDNSFTAGVSLEF